MKEEIKKLGEDIEESKRWLSKEYAHIRTGIASPAVLDAVSVEIYGVKQPVRNAASISSVDARTLRVSPFDRGSAKEIEKAIANADLGATVSVGTSGIHVNFPEMTSENREKISKLVKSKLEEARITVRGARDEAWKKIQNEEREGKIAEDDKFRLKDEMEKAVEAGNRELEKIHERKEKEVATI